VFSVVNAEGSTETGSLIDDIVREGARRMLAAALEAEVNAYIAGLADQCDEVGRRLVVRNGYHRERSVTTAAGPAEVKAPRVNDRRIDEATGERTRFSCRRGAVSRRRSPRCCRCSTCARAVVGGLRPGAGAVPRLGCRAVAGHRDEADQAVAG